LTTQTNGICNRLRKERVRLRLSQYAFGQIGSVEANAQRLYENGRRLPKANYLAAISAVGVDVLFVITGKPTPMPSENLTLTEEKLLTDFRYLDQENQDAIRRITTSMANLQHSCQVNNKPDDSTF